MKRSFRTAIGMSVVLLDHGLSSLVSLLTTILVARGCSREEYGLLVLCTAITVTVQGIQRGLVSVPLSVWYPRLDESGRREQLRSSFYEQLALTLVLITVGGLLALANLAPLPRGYLLLSLFVAILGTLLRDFVRYILLAQLKPGHCLALGLSVNLPTAVCLVLQFWSDSLAIDSVLMTIGLCSGLPALAFFYPLWPGNTLGRGTVVRHIRNDWKVGKWLLGCNTAYALSTQLGTWLLVLSRGPEDLAVLGVCRSAAALIGPLAGGISSYLLPLLSSAAVDHQRFRGLVERSTTLLTAGAAAYIVFGALAGETVVTLLYSSRYSGVGLVCLLCFAQAALTFPAASVDNALSALHRTDVAFYSLLWSMLAGVVLGVPLTLVWGTTGASVAALGCSALGLLYRQSFLRRWLDATAAVSLANQPNWPAVRLSNREKEPIP